MTEYESFKFTFDIPSHFSNTRRVKQTKECNHKRAYGEFNINEVKILCSDCKVELNRFENLDYSTSAEEISSFIDRFCRNATLNEAKLLFRVIFYKKIYDDVMKKLEESAVAQEIMDIKKNNTEKHKDFDEILRKASAALENLFYPIGKND